MRRHPSSLDECGILAIDPLYQRLGDGIHSMDSYSFSRYAPLRLQPVIRDLCLEAIALGVPLWVHWNAGLAIASAADMFDALQAIPDFGWPEDEPRLDSRLRGAIYGKPLELRGAGGEVVARSENFYFAAEHPFISELLPGVEQLSPTEDLDSKGSLCLFALDEPSGDVLNWFQEIAHNVRASDDSQRFYAAVIYGYANPWDLQDRTRYWGPQLHPPLVILRLPGEPEWQGEGAEAIEKLRSLASSSVESGKKPGAL